MKQRAFTLMELMIVIVIIGILSAVGMVMFGGQAEKAKIAAVKTNFKMVKKYVSVELMKCQMGDEYIFLNSGRYKISCSAVDQAGRTGSAVAFDSQFKKTFNPMDTIWGKDTPIMRHDGRPSDPIGDGSIGFIFYSFPSWPGALRSCFATPCSSSDNVLTATLNY